MITRSGECAPGPGFWVLSPGIVLRPVMEYAGSFNLTTFGLETRYVPGPGVCGILQRDCQNTYMQYDVGDGDWDGNDSGSPW